MKAFILSLICITMLASCKSEKTSEVKKKSRPNIIFIMSDDHAYQAISAYDDRLIETPNIDRLATEGMLFTNACVTNSICAPSRATILTGKHCHLHGKIDNHFAFDTTQVTFPQIFQNNGYKTSIFGKLHFGNNPKGVDEFSILPGQGNYFNPDFITSKGDTSIQGYVSDIITDMAIDWLDREAQDDEPFMMMYMHKAPHRPWWPRPDKFEEFTKRTFPEPATLFDDYSNRGTAAKTAEMNLLTHMHYGHDSKIRPETKSEMGDQLVPLVEEWKNGFAYPYGRASKEQKAQLDPVLDSINNYFKANWPTMSDKEKMQWKYQRYMQDYLACISSVDDNIGRLLEYLDETGLAENTIVVYTSDQGFYLGEHGWFDKRFVYNESFKTPLLVRWPGVVQAGTVENEMVQNLDFAQTLLEAAQIDRPADMQGESIIPLLRGDKDNWEREAVYYHYYEYPSIHMVKRHYAIVTKEYKLIHFYHDVDEWELYDRLNDPNEVNSIYDDPSYADVVKQLKADLVQMREKYKDSPELDKKFIEKYNQKLINR
ncbi:sulfatase family protein [Carboxylicivirga marina]|uniref:Sulfatase n=1 Tax=Carboxylicivirga marina TaxID=2800988 RepID=A0ABS1HGS4_9BACT|nr:sulfatase [Carboxylicivirga marina]MBK3516858.1 sulfatase [Carboxylicivirga marina]